ncbi:MAG: hypothetical protein K2N94_00740 [Lachnospiraceae bacterium]|nr:hypothetical protein [Lachnospiraceae bacterium]
MLENAMIVDWYWGEREYGVPLHAPVYDSGEEADYHWCPFCGAGLDPDERCDCEEGTEEN